MRRALALTALVLGLVLPDAAAAQTTVSLTAQPSVVPYGGTVQLTATVSPAAEVPVQILAGNGTTWLVAAEGTTNATGTAVFATRATEPVLFVARASAAAGVVDSPAVQVHVQPLLNARVLGRRVVGAPLVVAGTLLPANAGRLTLTVAGTTRRVRVEATGTFRTPLRAGVRGRVVATLRLAPAAGYVGARRSLVVRLTRPPLSLGATGVSVRALERRLHELRYALRGVGSYYGYDTYQAVLAFQKVHGMARTGRVGASVWRALERASIPRARVRSGSHIEVIKTTQVLYEVRAGNVVRVVHVSTGATGNTPVGRWRVYRRHTGTNSLHMSYPMYFLRGFAIHGYPSVPPYPASHGCVRLPVWFAPGLYARWPGLGVRIFVFP